MIDQAEKYLRDIIFTKFRVRYEENIAIIQVSPDEMKKLFNLNVMNEIGKKLKKIGFDYVTVDLFGYSSDNMNKTSI
jgi:uncharacterized protein